MSYRGRKKIKTPVKKKAAVPKTRKAAVPKTRKAVAPKTRKAAVPKTTKSNSETVAINENVLLKNNLNKTNADLIRVKKSNDDLLRQNNSLLAQITKLESLERTTKEKEIPAKTKEISTLKQRLALIQKEKIQFQDKNVVNERKIKDAMIRISDLEEQLKKKGAIPTIQPIAKTEFTNIFQEIIENFNQQSIGNENSKMDYIISDMDVELKAQVSYNSKGKMVLGTPDIANMEKAKDSFSVMKFKIRPIPRTNSVKIQ